MPALEVKTKKPRISIFKVGGSYGFEHFFEDKELFIGDMLSDRKIGIDRWNGLKIFTTGKFG